MKTIDVYTFYDKVSQPLAIRMLNNAKALASGEFAFNWNSYVFTDVDDCEWRVIDKAVRFPNASYSHGMACNSAIKHSTADYVMLIDADTAFLVKDWDKLLIEQLNNKCVCVGAEGVYRNSSIVPNPLCLIADGKVFRSIGVDFLPKLVGNLCAKTWVQNETQTLYSGRPIGTSWKFETGYKLRETLITAGYEFKTLKTYRTTGENKVAVYYLDGNSKPIVAHMVGSRSTIKGLPRVEPFTKMVHSYGVPY